MSRSNQFLKISSYVLVPDKFYWKLKKEKSEALPGGFWGLVFKFWRNYCLSRDYSLWSDGRPRMLITGLTVARRLLACGSSDTGPRGQLGNVQENSSSNSIWMKCLCGYYFRNKKVMEILCFLFGSKRVMKDYKALKADTKCLSHLKDSSFSYFLIKRRLRSAPGLLTYSFVPDL